MSEIGKTRLAFNPTTGALVFGHAELCRSFLKDRQGHYVYILRRPDGRPFYVGKGVRDRVFQHENEARHPNDWRSNAYKLNVIRMIWRTGHAIIYEIDLISDDAQVAIYREAELITSFGRLHEGGPLTNLDPGGGSIAGPAPSSKARHSATLAGVPDDNPERAVLNAFVLSIGRMDSVVIKPRTQFIPRPTQRFPRVSRKASFRQAAALAASASANGIMLDGSCNIPRQLQVDGIEGLVENGVACDILTSGMATIEPAASPEHEVFALSPQQAADVVRLVGRPKCIDLGLIPTKKMASEQVTDT